MSFVRELWEPEGLPQPLQRGRTLTNDEIYMGYARRLGADRRALHRVRGAATDRRAGAPFSSASRSEPAKSSACARQILSRLARRAYRRPVTPRMWTRCSTFFDDGRRDGGSFDAGIQFALERMLVDPDFLLRVHRDPRRAAARTAASYPMSDLEIASRLSFFLWSSIPDDELLRPRRAAAS